MDLKLKSKWLEALRSGKYKQGTLRLRSADNKFCCLGVLADVIDPDKWKMFQEYYTWDDYDYTGVSTCYLSRTIQNDLTYMNDWGHKSFLEIADFIEEKL